jgi:hypothetical protein
MPRSIGTVPDGVKDAYRLEASATESDPFVSRDEVPDFWVDRDRRG